MPNRLVIFRGIAKWALTATIVATAIGMMLVGVTLYSINNEIDLCFDQTSGRYIENDADREEFCHHAQVVEEDLN